MKQRTLIFLIAMIGLKFAAAQQRPAYISSAGLVAWYPLNGDAKDMSGNNNHGVNHNAAATMDRLGQPNGAMKFNGNSSYISIDLQSQPAISVPFTICAWYSTLDPAQMSQTILGKGRSADGSGLNFGFGTGEPPVTNVAYFGLQGEVPEATTTGNQEDYGEGWHFLVATFDGSTTALYMDGIMTSRIPILENKVPAIQNNLEVKMPLEIGRET